MPTSPRSQLPLSITIGQQLICARQGAGRQAWPALHLAGQNGHRASRPYFPRGLKQAGHALSAASFVGTRSAQPASMVAYPPLLPPSTRHPDPPHPTHTHLCIAQPRQAMHHSWPRDCEQDARPASEEAGCSSGIACRLLVAAGDEADARGLQRWWPSQGGQTREGGCCPGIACPSRPRPRV